MRQTFTIRRIFFLGLLLLIAGGGTIAWQYRTELQCWYYLRGLAGANKENRESWINKLAALEADVVPGLLNLLASPEPSVCANGEAALAFFADQWGRTDPRTLDVARQLNQRFANFSAAGKEAAIEWQLLQLKDPPPPTREMTSEAMTIFGQAILSKEKGIRERSLVLANVLLELDPCLECIAHSKELIRRELNAPEANCRTHAIHLTLHPVLQKETDLLQKIVPLLKDEEPQVRRAAVLAVGLAKDVISEDELLPRLHDEDKEVCRLCELALKRRGLSESHILLGKLITDARPQERMQILEQLPYVTDLDPGVWLQRLSQDSSEAVRAAAVRGMALYALPELRTRLQQMAQNDPSPTVRQNAGYYLKAEE